MYFEFNESLFDEYLNRYTSNYSLYYPCKVNCSDVILKKLTKREEISFEVDNLKMVKLLVEKYKVNPNKIMFNFLGRSKETTKKTIEKGVCFFTIDSLEDLDAFVCNNQKIKLLIRISINSLVEIKEKGFLNKWGATIEDAKILTQQIKSNPSLELVGYSFYFPKEYNTPQRINDSIKKIKKEFDGEYTIDIGGGISVEESEKIAKMPEVSGSKMIIEPGRNLVGDCFDLHCNIQSIRKANGENYLYLDVGIYSGFIDAIIKKFRFQIEPFKKTNGKKALYHVCGCTADISDYFGKYRFSEKDVTNNAPMVIKSCGAYCLQMHMNFSGHKGIKIKTKQ